MKTMYRLWYWPPKTIRGQKLALYPTPNAAMLATSHSGTWYRGEVGSSYFPGGWWITRGNNALVERWEVAPEKVPETDTDRIELAVKLGLDYGSNDGSHHKMWVIDQMLRILLDEKYTETIAQWCTGDDGLHTYEWDEGIAP